MINEIVKLAKIINHQKRAQAYGGFPQNLVNMNPQKLRFSPYSGAARPQQSSNRPYGLNFDNAASMLANFAKDRNSNAMAGGVPDYSGGIGNISGLNTAAPTVSPSEARRAHTPSTFNI